MPQVPHISAASAAVPQLRYKVVCIVFGGLLEFNAMIFYDTILFYNYLFGHMPASSVRFQSIKSSNAAIEVGGGYLKYPDV